MRIRVFIVSLLLASTAHAVELPRPALRQIAPVPRLYTITPYQLRTGEITEVVVQGDDLVPGMNWDSENLRVLKQQWVDSRTAVLTVFAKGESGIRSVSANGSQPLSFEVNNSTVLLSDDFDDGDISNWNSDKGTWTPINGQVEALVTKKGKLFAPLGNTDNITIDFDLNIISGKRVGIFFQYGDNNNYRLLYIDAAKKSVRLIDRFAGAIDSSQRVPFDAGLNVNHHYTVAVHNNSVMLTIDGNQIFNRDLGAVYSGTVAFYAKSCTAMFDNIVITRASGADMIPVVDFSYSVTGRDASFNAGGSVDPDGVINSYNWKFGDNGTGTGTTATHEYSSDGTYKTVLSVTDNSGATTKKEVNVTIAAPLTDKEAIQQVVRHFFELLADLENLTGEQICVDFSRQPNCPAFKKQSADLNRGRPKVDWFDVQFLSDVSVHFISSTEANPVKIRNKLLVRYIGDPTTYWTDGIHSYDVRKEGDGKWHQCSYTFDLIFSNDDH
jgi:hypothetical protein